MASSGVVIVGGGIVGMVTAYYLAKAGVPSVVVERDAIGSHASGFAYGGLSPVTGFGIPGPLAEVAQDGMRLHRELAESVVEETGIDIDFRVRPSLALAFTEAEAQRLQAALPWQQRQPGYAARWLDAAEARRVEPRISDEALGAVSIEGTADVEPYRLVLALTRAAERLGASVRHGRITGLRREGGKVTHVILERDEIACDTVVLALGPWSAEASAWLDLPIEVRPLKGQILRLQAPGPPVALLGRLGPQLRHHQARRPAVGGHDRGGGRLRRGDDARGARRDRRRAGEDAARDGRRPGRPPDRLPAAGGLRRPAAARPRARASTPSTWRRAPAARASCSARPWAARSPTSS